MKVFLAVFRHRNASAAAHELGLTNSNISRALANLRTMFDDELFVRTFNGFVPTERAVALSEQIEQIVTNLRSIGKQYTKFDPTVLYDIR